MRACAVIFAPLEAGTVPGHSDRLQGGMVTHGASGYSRRATHKSVIQQCHALVRREGNEAKVSLAVDEEAQ